MQFPEVSGSNLSGKSYHLPSDFEGTYNAVVIVYQRFQQANVDTWGSVLQSLAERYPDFRYYELPTLPDYGSLQQMFIDTGMRGGIRDGRVRARTITLYLDVAAFNAALELPTINDIYVLLVNRQGDILWRAAGDYTTPQGDALAQQIAALFTAPPVGTSPGAIN